MTDTILILIALFRPWRTFSQYSAHVVEAAIFLRQPTDWLTPDVRSVDRGLRGAHDLPVEFQNYIMADDLLRLLQAEYMSTEFDQAAFSLPHSP